MVAPCLYAERNDDLHAVWVKTEGGKSDVYYYKFNNGSQKWSDGTPLTQGAGAKNAALSGTYSGELHCVWQDQGNIYHRMWNVTAEEWNPAFLVAENAFDPIVLCDRSPNTHVVWVQRTNSTSPSTFLGHRYLDTRGEWSNATAISPQNAFAKEPAIALDRRNGIHAAFKMSQTQGGEDDLFYSYRKAGRDWDPYQVILEGTDLSLGRPAVAADDNGYAYVVWSQDAEGSSQLFLRNWKGNWEDPEQITNSTGTKSHPVISSDEDENLHLVWHQTPGGPDSDSIMYKRLWPNGIWTIPQEIGSSTSGKVGPPRIHIGPRNGDLHMLWTLFSDGNGQVLHATWPGIRERSLMRTASRARTHISEVERRPFVSPEGKDKLAQAREAYQAAIDSLSRFNASQAEEYFDRCMELLDEGYELDEKYKEEMGRRMGTIMALVGMAGGAVIIIGWRFMRP